MAYRVLVKKEIQENYTYNSRGDKLPFKEKRFYGPFYTYDDALNFICDRFNEFDMVEIWDFES